MTARRSRPRTWSGRSSAKARPRAATRSRSSGPGIDNFKIDGKRITADVKQYDPVLFKWMAFLTGYVLPKAYFEKVGPQGFEKKPIGTGPYMVDAYEGNAYLRLKANPKYWGGKPAFETVVFKFVPDATSRVAEIESGSSDITLEVPYEEYDRLKGKAGLKGECTPISDIGMIFITNGGVMDDKNVRLAMCHAVDKDAIIKRLLRGYGVAHRHARGAGIRRLRSVDQGARTIRRWRQKLLAASGYSKEKPVKFTIQTTRGFKPKDYEMIQAIVGMWRNVGIDANIEVYEIAKHFELRMSHKLAPAAFYNWGNAIGDPTTSTGFAMFSKSPHSAGIRTISTPRSVRCGARRTRRSASRLERRRPLYRRAGLRAAAAAIRAADPLQVRLSRSSRTFRAPCSRRRWSRRPKISVDAVRRRAGARRPSTRSFKDR